MLENLQDAFYAKLYINLPRIKTSSANYSIWIALMDELVLTKTYPLW